MKLEIKAAGDNGSFIHGSKAALLLDGVDVSRFVSRVVLDVPCDGVVTATIEILPTEVIVDAAALAVIERAGRE